MQEPIIELRSASISHRNGNVVLQGIDLTINAGEYVYLIGKTAAGKSSLIKTLTGELPLVDGHGKVGEFELKDLKESKIPYLRRSTGIVFQDFQLLTDRTVYNNLHFVLKATGWTKHNEMDARIKEVLAKVGLSGKEPMMPNQLSGGEQQRVVIARALLNNPEIILADEPTGNLDPATSEEITKLLHEICKTGKTVLMATHNYSLLKRFPARTIQCEGGKITEVKKEETEIDFGELLNE